MKSLVHPRALSPSTRAPIFTLAAICLSLTMRPANAIVISYAFDPGSEATYADGNVEEVSGFITVDTVLGGGSGVVTLSGPPPQAGVYDQGSCAGDGGIPPTCPFLYLDAPVPTAIYFDPSDLFIPVNHTLVAIASCSPLNPNQDCESESVTGGVFVTAITVPEPSTIVLLIPALGLLLLRRWRTRLRLALVGAKVICGRLYCCTVDRLLRRLLERAELITERSDFLEVPIPPGVWPYCKVQRCR